MGGRSLAYVPCPRCLLARRRAGSSGSSCFSPFFPRVLKQFVGFSLPVVEATGRLGAFGVGLQGVSDVVHRAATDLDFASECQAGLAFADAAQQQDDLRGVQVLAFKDRTT